ISAMPPTAIRSSSSYMPKALWPASLLPLDRVRSPVDDGTVTPMRAGRSARGAEPSIRKCSASVPCARSSAAAFRHRDDTAPGRSDHVELQRLAAAKLAPGALHSLRVVRQRGHVAASELHDDVAGRQTGLRPGRAGLDPRHQELA